MPLPKTTVGRSLNARPTSGFEATEGRSHHLEGQGDLASRLIRGIIGLLYRLSGFLTYLVSPPDPPSMS